MVAEEMVKRGFSYDSNLCLYLQPNLFPLRHESGLVRFPVFWEDDVHWRNGGEWNIDKYLSEFLSPGLKVINFHPFLVAANIPNQEYYNQYRNYCTTLAENDAGKIRYKGEGARTFLIKLLELLSDQGHRFYSLKELYEMVPMQDFLLAESQSTDRQSEHSDEEYQRYWTMPEAEKQQFLRQSYQQRNAKDVYATSRDYNARELEITSIKMNIADRSPILDLGCGNGYTLISLAKDLKDVPMLGVDFTESLIEGAIAIRDERKPELQSLPEFICADAVEYIQQCEGDSMGYILTERFLQNLPNINLQKEIVREAFRVLMSGGRFLMCEGSEDGFLSLNRLRESVGLSTISATSNDNVSAIRIKDEELEEFATNKIGFRLIRKLGYSQYFVMTRVLHPLQIYPRSPRFDAPINVLAKLIQENMPFDPGYGSNTLWVFEKSLPENS